MNFVGNMQNAPVISPVLIIVLCAVAGLGTVLLLPGGREGAVRKIGVAVILLAALLGASTLIRYAANAADPMGVYFWVFATIAGVGSLRVITHSRPVYSALYFVLTIFASAGLFVLLWAEFMAAALVLIYAGAILVTYVFVIMLAARSGGGGEISECDNSSREPVAAAAVGFALMALLLYVIFDKAPAATGVTPATAVPEGVDLSVTGLARYLFQNQLVNLELAGVILTLAMVGAIAIAKRRLWSAQPTLHREEPPVIGEDNPHAIDIVGTTNPRQKAYPET